MTRFAFDLYPRDDPKDGTRLVRFTQLQDAEYRKDANGTGAGKIALRASSSDAAFIDPQGLQYVRVVLIKNDASEVTYGGFFLEKGDYAALTETSTELLTFSGAGSLTVLQRAIAAEASYIVADDPVDGYWQWFTQSGGEILDRMVREAQAVARPQDPLPMVTMDFDGDNDSSSTPWPVDNLGFRFAIGRNLLELAQELMGLGLFVDMDGDFGLHAWISRGTDRTGGAWGSGVIRFQAPSAGTVATGSIKSDAIRGLAAFIQRSDMLVGSPEGGYEWVPGGAGIGLQGLDWEGFTPTESVESTARVAVGEAQLNARDDAGATVRLRTKFGETPASGIYAPGLHYDVADLVTLHTGTGTWDWNESEQIVNNVTVKLRDGGDWDVWVDLGSAYNPLESHIFGAATATAFDRFFVDDSTPGGVWRMRERDYGEGVGTDFYRTIAASRGETNETDAYIDLRADPDGSSGDKANLQLFASEVFPGEIEVVAYSIIDLAGDGEIVGQATDTVQFEVDGPAGATMIRLTGTKIWLFSDIGVVLPVFSADPAGGDSEAGQVYYNDGSNTIRWYDGTVWDDLGGGVGGSHTHVYSEIPAGTINGSNAAFTLAATPSASTLQLYKNGLRQRVGSGNDYTLATNTITYEAGNVPQTGDSHVADYVS